MKQKEMVIWSKNFFLKISLTPQPPPSLLLFDADNMCHQQNWETFEDLDTFISNVPDTGVCLKDI